MNKGLKIMVGQLEKMLGLKNAGLLIANILDALNEMVDGKDSFELRSLKLVFNGFFEKEVIGEE